MNAKKKRGTPRVFKNLEEARAVLKNEAREFLKRVDITQLDALITQRKQRQSNPSKAHPTT